MLCGFIRYTFKTGLCRDTSALISIKLVVELGMTKLYNMVPIRMTLTFAQGHKGTRKLEYVQSFCCRVA